MASIIEGVDQRTQLVGQNRLELLLFKLGGLPQQYGINVFKVKEALPCPKLTKIPNSHPVIRGAAHLRGKTISIFDLSKGIGGPAVEDISKAFVIITEYNRSVQGFLVSEIVKIINTSWKEILPPPAASGSSHYMTAVSKQGDEIIQIIDVEKVMAEVLGTEVDVSDERAEDYGAANAERRPHVLVADDSSVARKQVQRTLEQIGIDATVVKDGKEAFEQLRSWVDEGINVQEHIDMLISDIEMPEMDGYTLTSAIRHDPELKSLRILLHSSMSGDFNTSMVKKVEADKFIPKFSPDELADAVQEMLKAPPHSP
jgi:two-component system chemotaxis response regulator CheV